MFGEPGSARALGVCVVVAVIYGWVAFFLGWGVFHGSGKLGNVELLPDGVDWKARGIVLLWAIVLPLAAFSRGALDLSKFKAAATATCIKDRRINIRLSSPDLMDIQARALEEGIPYQTFIASVLHKYVSGRLVEKTSNLSPRSTKRADDQPHDP